MINISAIQSLARIHPELIPDITKTWKVGQILNATAERNVKANDNILIRIGQSILESKTPIALKAGDPLKLLIQSLGNTPVLKIQAAANTPKAAAQNLKSFIGQQQNLTNVLPLSQKIINIPSIPKVIKQQLIDLNQKIPTAEQATQAATLKKIIRDSGIFLESKLNHLQKNTQQRETLRQQEPQQTRLKQDIKSQLLKISTYLQREVPELAIKSSSIKNLNAAVDTIVKQFIKGDINLKQLATLLTAHLPKKQNMLIQQSLIASEKILLPALLANKLQNSFTILLNHLQQQDNPKQIQAHLSNLLKTMDLLQELKTGIDGALAKTTSQQLTMLTRDADSLLLLIFDLYLKNKTENHLFQFRLEQETSTKEKDASNWTVALHFNFKELGPIQAKLRLNDNHLSTTFHAEQKSTAKNIEKQMDWLDTALKHIGFDTVTFGVVQGSLNKAKDVPDNVRILDEKA